MFNREPVWSKEPDIAVIKTFAQKHLRDILTDDDHGSIRVDFFAQGAFNKLYEITCGQHAQRFIFRVLLSLDPFFKVESEVATMKFLSGFPVPRVIAWDSDSRTELGFEWLLMELIDGVPLCDVWRQILWERKVTLTEEVSKIVVKIETYTFDSIGSLYSSSSLQSRTVPEGADASQLETLRSTPGSSTKLADTEDFPLRQMKADVPVLEEFALSSKSSVTGHMVAPIFITDSRLELPANRGPFQNSLEWMRAAIEIQLEWINKGLSLLGSKRDDVDPGYDSDLEDEAPEMKNLCHRYLELIPQIFAEETSENQFVLHHHDLNAANILVYPETFKITGIVDWEMTCVVPQWKAAVEPVFLQDADFDWKTEEPPIPPSYDMEKDQYAIEARDRGIINSSDSITIPPGSIIWRSLAMLTMSIMRRQS